METRPRSSWSSRCSRACEAHDGASGARNVFVTKPAPSKAFAEINDLFDELDTLLKNPDAGADLAKRGVNISLAIVAADGLRAYLHGDKARAAEDLGTAAEEIASRLGQSQAEPYSGAKKERPS